ncbi:metallophosphoesterase family protein [Polluticaenibacter yanchengensis]|uniref:Metallophosphoesterase family protein n=1 Tax=Polluticaenibacter yanchengensis TaxID=3014562 RepID=A0ABT4UEW3_9BACT|nr:metallophosphoesterase family protein [Chitinophagaceae bacterium LY-5]
MSTYAIGDIHGGLKALEEVLLLAPISKEDTLIFLGDYVDGWSQSAQVVSFLMDLSRQYHCIFIKGNHDNWCEDWLRNGKPNDSWLRHGGISAMASYHDYSEQEKMAHLHWFEALRLFYIDDKKRLFIHAGFTSIHGPEHEFKHPVFSWDRTLWEVALTMDKRIKKDSLLYPKRLKLFEEIFIGHTPTLYYNSSLPLNGCNVWNIDTGAAFTGPLTIMNVDTKEYWQTEPVYKLYPNELGRNKAKS